jgi:predicted dinucleotide-binding enzyme
VDAVAQLINEIGPQVVPVEVSDALLAEFVVLATPFEAVRELVERVGDWRQRIIIDATNAIDYTDFSPADLGGRPSSDLGAEWATKRRVARGVPVGQ